MVFLCEGSFKIILPIFFLKFLNVVSGCPVTGQTRFCGCDKNFLTLFQAARSQDKPDFAAAIGVAKMEILPILVARMVNVRSAAIVSFLCFSVEQDNVLLYPSALVKMPKQQACLFLNFLASELRKEEFLVENKVS